MDLGEAVFRLFSGGRSPREPYSKRWVAEGIARAGGVSQLARALGIHRTTVQGWTNKGKTPTVESQELLRVALRNARMSDSREARLRAKDEITVQGTQDDGGTRHRVIHLDARYLAPGTMNRAMSAYLAGASPAELHRVVWQGIHSAPFYKAVFHPGGPGAQGRATGPRNIAPAPTAPAGGSGGGGGASGGSGGRYDFSGPEEFVDDDGLAYEGWAIDDDYGVSVSAVA